MGLGKTVQTLAHLAIEQAAGRLDRPALIVCPTSLVPNWLREAGALRARRCACCRCTAPTRQGRFGEIAAHDLVLTTYPLLTRDQEVLTAQDWHVVVLDEAQTIKNPNAEATRQALRLQARASGFASPARRWRTTWASSGRCSTSSRRASSATRGASAAATARRSRSTATRSARRRCTAACGPSCCAGPRRRWRPNCRRRPRSPSRWRWSGAARGLRGDPAVDACQGQAGDRREGPGAVRHHHPGCAAEAAPGLLRPAAAGDEVGAERPARPSWSGCWSCSAILLERGAARADLLPVHHHAGADRGGAARDRHRPTCC